MRTDEPQSARRADPDADRLYRDLVYPGARASSGGIAGWDIVALPGEAPRTPLQTGDLLVRVWLGKPGLGHVAVVTDPVLISHDHLAAATGGAERAGPGFYATVTDDGPVPHTRADRFARLILDTYARMPQGQLLLRPTPAEPVDLAGEGESGSEEGGGRAMIDVSGATRYIAVASPSQLTNDEWRRVDPDRPPGPPVYNDYALMKVLYNLRIRGLRKHVHVNAFQYDQPLAPLDFSALQDSDVIFIAGHGNDRGLYAMGPDARRGMDRLVDVLTADGNLKKLRTDKKIIILLLSCRAGLGFHKALARRLSKKLSIDTTVGGAQGFTFGSARTGITAHNEVLIRGIPWYMEYPGSIKPKDAENETSAREGKTITIAGKKPEIDQFLHDKTVLEKQFQDLVQQLRSTEVNKALDEIDIRFRSRWLRLLQAQFELYALAKKRSNLEFDMWFDLITDGYLWTDGRKTTDAEVAGLISGALIPVGDGFACTR
jgi:hypothetical protein